MLQSVDECGPPLSATDLDEYEVLVGAQLPEDYKSFLRTYNGGSPCPKMVPVSDFPEDSASAELRTLYGISDPIESCELGWNFREFRDRLPNEVIPIGSDSLGDVFCMCIRGWRYGHIYFFDALELQQADELDDLYWVADSFTSMLDSLHTPEE